MFQRYKAIDLTQTINPSIPTWEGNCGFQSHLIMDYPQGYRLQRFEMHAGIGTHMDAPAHFVAGGVDIASLPLENLMVAAHVINVADNCHSDLIIMPDAITAYENKYGQITANSLVIFYSGWSRYWHDAEKYRNVDATGIPRFPQVALSTAEELLKRNIVGIAVDTLSPECTDSKFSLHHLLLGADKYIIENIANANLLPESGAYVIALPLKIAGGTEAAARVVGLVKP